MATNEEQKAIRMKVFSVALVLFLVVLGVSYAYWTVTLVQADEDVITTTCLSVTYEDVTEGINIAAAYPISDEEGNSSVGYKFKITNNCDSYVVYNVNLESLASVALNNRISLNSLNATLNGSEVKRINAYSATDSVLSASEGVAYDTRILDNSVLTPVGTGGASKTYTLRIWLDKNAPESEMNKLYRSKISVFGEMTSGN